MNPIKITPISKIEVSVANNNYDSKYFNSFELRQKVKIESELKTTSDGFQLFDSTLHFDRVEERVLFQRYPKNITLQDVQKRLTEFEKKGHNCLIFKQIASTPILTEKEISNLQLGYNTLEQIESKQLVQFMGPNGLEIGYDANGRKQYKKLFLSLDYHDDEDYRQTEEEEATNPNAIASKWFEVSGTTSKVTTQPVIDDLPF